MIDIDWTMPVQILNFLVLVYLLNIVLFRPIRKSLKDRQAHLKAFEADLQGLAAGQQGVLSQVEAKLTEARREGLSQREGLRQEGSQYEASLLEEVKREVEAEWTRVEAKIKADMAKAREALQAQVQDFAFALATKILGRKLS
jgi:F-type H+-transporting ATPase subunit b